MKSKTTVTMSKVDLLTQWCSKGIEIINEDVA